MAASALAAFVVGVPLQQAGVFPAKAVDKALGVVVKDAHAGRCSPGRGGWGGWGKWFGKKKSGWD